MGILNIQVNDKTCVYVEYEDGRKVKYLYSALLSEHPDVKDAGQQIKLPLKEGMGNGH